MYPHSFCTTTSYVINEQMVWVNEDLDWWTIKHSGLCIPVIDSEIPVMRSDNPRRIRLEVTLLFKLLFLTRPYIGSIQNVCTWFGKVTVASDLRDRTLLFVAIELPSPYSSATSLTNSAFFVQRLTWRLAFDNNICNCFLTKFASMDSAVESICCRCEWSFTFFSFIMSACRITCFS